jgi:hypothetical protein
MTEQSCQVFHQKPTTKDYVVFNTGAGVNIQHKMFTFVVIQTQKS